MNWTEYVAGVSAASVLLGGIMGAWTKAWIDSRAIDRRDNLDQLQLALSTISKLEARADMQGGQIHNLGTRIEQLLVANTRLEASNEALLTANRSLRRDVTDLQNQLKGLGHTPIMSDDVATYSCDPSCPLAQSKAAEAAAAAASANNIAHMEDGK